ncbi:leucine-rich repeat flightless-interacting protein 1 isoform X6 [Nannospalax galili]|uniref:leucine-rich repeat flightless-interacting protein 1 isoform X6 n=1 Tax=Nannospalax galili TaxID=1026970 RepID=UPI00111C4949|nr:leucine-rich repeat flightless-interacting protein 1 isoform X6 [Nannospalax galili]
MDMGTQGPGRKRLPNRERLTAEDDALNLIAREAEARLAAKRAARAEAREIRMKELERQQKEIYQVQKKYYGLDTKWGDIEQWMEDSERYSRRSRRNTSASDEDERLSVGSRSSLRTNGYDGDCYGSQSLSRRSGRNSSYSSDSRFSALSTSREEKLPSEYSGHLNSSSRASSRASSARASPVVEERPDKDFTEKGSRNMPSLSAATLASLGGTSSRRGSGDTSISIDTEASIREIKELNELKDQIQDVEGKYMQGLKEMKDSLAEVEEKYKRAMVSNAQLDNEKTNFMYQVDTLKDTLLELEERLAESQQLYEEKCKEFEREKHAHGVLQFQFAEVKEALRQREEALEEIRQLQQKQAGYIREISDLQDTMEWKDKKIGALERQKEFFDSIRSERDDLREEIVKLKEELKKHGIILNSEIATNGETSDTLNDVGYQGPTKMTREELNALKSAGEGTLGKAKEVEVRNEIVENVGKGEILPNTEQEQHKEDTVQHREVLHPGENAETQKPAEDSAPSPGPLAHAKCEQQVQSQVHKNTSFLENPEQTESHEVTDKPDDRTRNALEQSDCLGDLDSEGPGPTHGQGGCDALGIQNQSANSLGSQEIEKQEGLKADLKEASSEPHPDSVLAQFPEADKVSCADSGGTGENNTENVAETGGAVGGEQVDVVTSRPPEHADSTASQDGTCVVDGVGPGTGQEKPAQTEVQASPGAPIAQSIPEDAIGPGSTDAKIASLDMKEPKQEKNTQEAEALGSPQKKTKNRKKKNKKKKSAAPVEALKDHRKESGCQSTEAGEVEEGDQGQLTDKSQVAGTQNGEVDNPKQEILAGNSEHVDCPEDPKAELNGKQNEEEEEEEEEEDVKTQVSRVQLEDEVTQPSGSSVEDEQMEQHVTKGPTNGPTEPECEEGSDGSHSEKKSPPEDVNRAAQTESAEEHVLATHPGQTAENALDSGILEHYGLSGELGDTSSESQRQASGADEKGKSREDCTMS